MKAVFDVETSVYSKGHPYDSRNFLVAYSFYFENGEHLYARYDQPDFITKLRENIARVTEVIGHNIKFDIAWIRRVGLNLPVNCRVWDSSLAEFILSGQTSGFISLNDSLAQYGYEQKDDRVKEYWDSGVSTEDIPEDVLEEYTKRDTWLTWLLYATQQQLCDDKQKNLIYIEGEDLLTLQDAEQNGILFNRKDAEARSNALHAEILNIETKLKQHIAVPPTLEFNFDSGDHVSAFLYGGIIEYKYAIPEERVYKSGPNKGQAYIQNRWHNDVVKFERLFTPLDNTEVKKTQENSPEEPHYYQTDEPTLKQLKGSKRNKDLLDCLMARSKLIKIKEFLDGLGKIIDEKHWEYSIIHGQYNQNIARTGRLSSSSPNMQNMPPEVDKFIVSRNANS